MSYTITIILLPFISHRSMSVRRDRIEDQFKFTKCRATVKRHHISPISSSPHKMIDLSGYRKSQQNQIFISRKKKHSAQMAVTKSPKSREDSILEKKERQIMSKLLRTKMQKTRGKRWRTEYEDQRLILRKHTISEVQNLQFQILKPTDKLFHRLDNMRLAEKILLARPSVDLNRSNLSSFYKKQKSYEINIRKMPTRTHFKSRHQRTNKKQWID